MHPNMHPILARSDNGFFLQSELLNQSQGGVYGLSAVEEVPPLPR